MGLDHLTSVVSESFEVARVSLERAVKQRPNDPNARGDLALAYGHLGRKDDAIAHGKRATDMYPATKDAFSGVEVVLELGLIYTMVGEYDTAMDHIEYLLSIPSTVSVPWLRLDPRWRPLWDHPRFQELVARYGNGATD